MLTGVTFEDGAAEPDGELRTAHSPKLVTIVMSLTAQGMSNAAISRHLHDVEELAVPADQVKRISDSVVKTMEEWRTRPLSPMYPLLVVDAIHVKIRGSEVANRPVYVVLGATAEGQRDLLGFWIGEGNGESAKYWLKVLTELKNRGLRDVLFLSCDGLAGLPGAVEQVWPQTVVLRCVVHLMRRSYQLTKRNWAKVRPALMPVVTAVNAEEARQRLDEFTADWGGQYPAVVNMWENAWPEFIALLEWDREIRRILGNTNAVESVNSQIRRAVNHRRYFASEAEALKTIYLVLRGKDHGKVRAARWSQQWEGALNAFHLAFPDRMILGTSPA